jgi:hypothetical protein
LKDCKSAFTIPAGHAKTSTGEIRCSDEFIRLFEMPRRCLRSLYISYDARSNKIHRAIVGACGPVGPDGSTCQGEQEDSDSQTMGASSNTGR